MLGLRGEETIQLVELILLLGAATELHELLQLRLLAAAANLECQEVLHARIVKHGHVRTRFTVASFEHLVATAAQLVEIGPRAPVIEDRRAIPIERGRGLVLGALGLNANVVIIVIVIFLLRGPLIDLVVAANDAQRLLAVLEHGGRTVASHNDLAAQVAGQLLIEGSSASGLKSINGAGGTLMLHILIILNRR